MNEFELINRYFKRPCHQAVLGIGDDAALIEPSEGQVLAVSADMLVAGQHFFADTDPFKLGHKALAVNLSDMAAMGANPRWVMLSLALPQVDQAWLQAFSDGFFKLAEQFGVELIGGDTTKGPLNISVQIMGEVPKDQALRRDGARAGDDIWVSGTLGDAALALAGLKQQIQLTPDELAVCREKLESPMPRVALGLALRGIAHSAIDLSDGLLADLGHILDASKVGARLQLTDLPLSPIVRHYQQHPLVQRAYLAGGDDYELCFTVPSAKRKIIQTISAGLHLPLTRIGRITDQLGLHIFDQAGQPIHLSQQGFDHFES